MLQKTVGDLAPWVQSVSLQICTPQPPELVPARLSCLLEFGCQGLPPISTIPFSVSNLADSPFICTFSTQKGHRTEEELGSPVCSNPHSPAMSKEKQN